MARPTWSGSIQISLVTIAVKIFPATNPGRQVEFHQIDRETGERVHHKDVADGADVEKTEIVKGFEYAKGRYVAIEPDELKALSLPTATAMQIKQFVQADELALTLFDRPYFVAPQNADQARALGIMRRAMAKTNTYGIGEIAFSGREHLVAIGAPSDPKQKGLMLYTLRYKEELRSASSVIGDFKEPAVDAEELSLATHLIERGTSKFDLADYTNDYVAAVKKLVERKRKGKSIEAPAPETKPAKVVNIMDALRESLATGKPSRTTKAKSRSKKAARKSAA
jgi:DNA end-binding protein Ku